MSKYGRRKVVKVINEATMGTALAATNEVWCFAPELQRTDNTIQREISGSFGGPAPAIPGPSLGTGKLKTEVRSDGTSNLHAGLLAMLCACGLKATGLVLAPSSVLTDLKTLSVEYWADGLLKKLSGAMGEYELSGEFGKQAMLDFNFNGIFTSAGDDALPASTRPSAKAMIVRSCTVSLGAHTPLGVSKFSIKPGHKVETREDITSATGIAHYIIAPPRRYTISLDPEVEAAATWDPVAIAEAATEVAFSLVLSDGTVNVTIAAPKLQLMPPQEAVRESKMIYDLTGQCNCDTGDDDISITTAAVVP